ncbi:transcriptional regulator, GntR family [Thermomonospora echinospora]|uniref:Transcriptional regulator, GntR family n=1 Tax=Thermomonospora echinospora TaxID=1992 RepID=A0A1H6CF61_9ACTN|nr:PLP-dependent aminotransferase family protein [Thermomonospora echinospora]SEG70976.1 transcriptional regulator, GntR family [Thermomonospora echinospora]
MEFHVSLAGRGDLATRIYRQLLDAVLDGRLRAGERLPSTRELARRLGVSRNTVAVAYDRLTAEGFLVGRVGAGTFVCEQPLSQARPRNAPAGGGVRPRALWESLADLAGHAEPPPYDFRVGMPDPALFPLETWRRLIARELRRSSLPSGYAEPAGHAGLRAAIARYVGVARSVKAGADDIIVTQGAQQALDIIARVLVEPGCRVAVEEPGHRPARLLLQSLGARVTGVPVDSEGLDVARLPRDARLVYVTPSHQFPLGTPMSLARRAALLDWAERNDAVVIEDDYDSEYRFEGRPLEPLQSLDRYGRVVYVGSFSKTLLPMLRLGFLVAPASLRPALRAAKRLTDWHGDPISQGALASFLDEGLMARHVRRATREYAVRRTKILTGLREHLPGLLQPVPSAAGLHLCARLAPDAAVDLEGVIAAAHASGVGVDSLADYCGEHPAQAGLMLGYGGIRPSEIAEGLRRLAECFTARHPH